MTTKQTRRHFIQSSSAAVAASSLIPAAVSGGDAVPQPAGGFHSSGSAPLKIGLIGCGGRGTSAVGNALKADENAVVTALADAFRDRLESCQDSLKTRYGDRIQVPNEHKFIDFNCYQQLIDTDVDVVLLATPPHFRPMQMEAAVAANKHIFCEKPVATDSPGVRRVLKACEEAAAKDLNVVSGLCWRYDIGVNEMVKRINDGAIGDIRAIQANYLTGELWHHPRQDDWSEMEYQCRNWLYFNWLSGDHITEQHIHTLDKGLWLKDDEPPAFCSGMGGRQKRISDRWGNIFDHFATIYEWADGTKMFSYCRQMNECFSENECHVIGTTGNAQMLRNIIVNDEGKWRRRGRKPSMYDIEHDYLFRAIRGEIATINNGDYMCKSTMMALMGRQASYTGKKITWDDAWNDNTALGPDSYEWGDYDPQSVAVPGSGPS